VKAIHTFLTDVPGPSRLLPGKQPIQMAAGR